MLCAFHMGLHCCTGLGVPVYKQSIQFFFFVECELPRSRGTCKGKYTRFYYDKTSGQCKGFKYSGCGGNLNNFESLSDCNHRCICSRQLAVGTCSQGQPRYFYNKATGLCQVFAYSGCGGNVNNFLMEDHCKSVCIDPEIRRRCLRRPEIGSCTNNMTRYYYDVNCDCCRQFSYSGCDGNRNNFETENSCLQKCHSIEGMRGATTNIPVPTASAESSTASPTTAAPSKKDAGSNMIIIQTNPGPPPGQRINNIFQQLLNNMMLPG